MNINMAFRAALRRIICERQTDVRFLLLAQLLLNGSVELITSTNSHGRLHLHLPRHMPHRCIYRRPASVRSRQGEDRVRLALTPHPLLALTRSHPMPIPSAHGHPHQFLMLPRVFPARSSGVNLPHLRQSRTHPSLHIPTSRTSILHMG